MAYIGVQVLEHVRNQVAKVFDMFQEEEVYHDAIGYDEYFGPSPEGEVVHVDPRNWDLYWVTHSNGSVEDPKGKSTLQPELDCTELEFPREDAPQGLIDCLVQGKLEASSSKKMMSLIQDEPGSGSEIDTPEVPGNHADAIEEHLRQSFAKLSSIIEAEASAPQSAESDSTEVATNTAAEAGSIEPALRPPSFLSREAAKFRTYLKNRPAIFSQKLPDIRGLMPNLKLKLNLPVVKLPILNLPVLADPGKGSQPSTLEETVAATPKKEPEPIHYERTPLATYARVKSRLQDRPPLVAAFADQVSVLNPASLVPKDGTSEEETPKGHLASKWDVLLKNLGDLLPTPLAALTTGAPRKRSLASILGGHAAKKVFAQEEHDPLDDSMIPQYQRWKKIKNKKLHNAQWSCLIIACILLICAVHIQKLREIKWWKFEFWQWLALGFVALAGRLISGWGIKVSRQYASASSP